MSRFYVGQMVETTWANNPEMLRMIGHRGVILRAASKAGGWIVDGAECTREGFMCSWSEIHLRPVYDGNQPVAWEECAWRPEKVTA